MKEAGGVGGGGGKFLPPFGIAAEKVVAVEWVWGATVHQVQDIFVQEAGAEVAEYCTVLGALEARLRRNSGSWEMMAEAEREVALNEQTDERVAAAEAVEAAVSFSRLSLSTTTVDD
eukprot:CAMPEP_0183298086 /NCGR_PEP_ID=MMETSP0160_2-20130417/5206_1 /TAXON_ID=2839 ORGANISM="Odontella Sinensis, Strain Grunow 1884" /NCGR_SAMPLE_ID=MMETSP0160_2 /ASSEMBLY_ACC=CAM_ASM_000250 /LENGTH=116 /DNA_ID=CAMNT_0025460037 /DNA_START=453 /DNA_END=801 /DNA_ORIENTATION=-